MCIRDSNGLFYFRNKVDPEINPICRFCLEQDETFYQFLTDCPALRLTRQNVFLDQTIDNDMKWSIRELLLFSHKAGIEEAINGDTGLDFYDNLYRDDALESSVSDDGG